MNLKIIVAIGLILVAATFLIPTVRMNARAASLDLNLPEDPVQVDVINGTDSFYNASLSNVPAGYDVTNGSYRAWCVDRRYGRPILPFVTFLYSSSNPPLLNDTVDLVNQRWDMVNYILNHKQGIVADVQQALWYFVNFRSDYNYTPTRPAAIAMVEDAVLNGAGFIPSVGQAIAIICYPDTSFVQISVIEVFLKSSLTGDINNDGRVDISDCILLSAAFSTKPGDPNWNPHADLNNDGAIDIFDAIILSAIFGRTV